MPGPPNRNRRPLIEPAGEDAARRRAPLFAFLAARAASDLGEALALVAIPWFVLQTTGSAARTGVTAFATFAPPVLAGIFGGALVDRLGYRSTSVLADLASGVPLAMIPVLHRTTGLAFWQLLTLVFISALLDAPGRTARKAMLPELAEAARTPIERATSASDGATRVAQLVGLPAAGLLIATVGAANVLLIDAATFVVSAALVAVFVPRPAASTVREPAASTYISELRDGVAFIWRHPLLRSIVALIMLTNAVDGALFSVALPVYADQVLGGALDLGMVAGALAGGAIVGGIAFGAVGHRLSRRAVFLPAYTLSGTRFWALVMFPGVAVLTVVHAVSGLAIGPINPILSATQYDLVPEGRRGRVFGAMTAGVFAAIPLGGLVAGYAIELLGLRIALLAMATAYTATTLVPIVSPAWRQT